MGVILITAAPAGADLSTLYDFLGGIDSFSNGTGSSFNAENSGDGRKFNFSGFGLTFDGNGRPLHLAPRQFFG